MYLDTLRKQELSQMLLYIKQVKEILVPVVYLEELFSSSLIRGSTTIRISKERPCSITILKQLTWTCQFSSQTGIWRGGGGVFYRKNAKGRVETKGTTGMCNPLF